MASWNFPDHPDIASALETGYPRRYWERSSEEDDYDPDDAYEEYRSRRDGVED